MPTNTQLIVVLDVDTRSEAERIVSACYDCDWFKVGSQLFTRCGPEVVRHLIDQGKQVMLDLKFHDIPNTVAHAARAAADLETAMFTLHASGGSEMIRAARAAVEGTPTQILAVTVLTSMSDATLNEELRIQEPAAQAVARLAKLAVDSGAHGIVCSPREIALVRDAVGPEPLVVTPGIRPDWASADDQKRIMTPAAAAAAGASFVVVGRPILKHPEPATAVKLVLEELRTTT